MAGACETAASWQYHPWREVCRRTHLIVNVAANGEDFLRGCIRGNRIILDPDLTQAERRCTICHELVHDERRIFPCDPVLRAREEVIVERIAACRLIRLPRLLDAVQWTRSIEEAAEVLWVDVPMLQARIAALGPAERALLDAIANDDAAA